MKKQDIWVLAEQRHGKIQAVSYELLARGRELAVKTDGDLNVMVIGASMPDVELQGLIARGADLVIAAEAPELATFMVEPYAAVMLKMIAGYQPEIVLAGATSTGRTLMPYVAMKAGTGLTADCTLLDIEAGSGLLLQTRPAIGGNIMATIKCTERRPQMATVRPRSMRQAEVQSGRQGKIIRLSPDAGDLRSRITYQGFTAGNEDQDLQDADKVVVVGRGIKKAENIRLVRDLAEALGAALGATREVVDRGWLSYPHQVGLSGKTISPKLYIGVGVSGAIQHLAGMQTAETIVAINRDPEANIFSVADFGITGNLFDILPALTAMIKQGNKPW